MMRDVSRSGSSRENTRDKMKTAKESIGAGPDVVLLESSVALGVELTICGTRLNCNFTCRKVEKLHGTSIHTQDVYVVLIRIDI